MSIKDMELDLERTTHTILKNKAWVRVNEARAEYLRRQIKFGRGDYSEENN